MKKLVETIGHCLDCDCDFTVVRGIDVHTKHNATYKKYYMEVYDD